LAAAIALLILAQTIIQNGENAAPIAIPIATLIKSMFSPYALECARIVFMLYCYQNL
jgi:hypothetical protein